MKRKLEGDYAWVIAGPVWIQILDGKIASIAKNAYQTLDSDMRTWVVASIERGYWTVRDGRDGVLDLKIRGFAVALKQAWFEVSSDAIKDVFS